MDTYAWELQRQHGDLWFPVGGDDAAGVEQSPGTPPMEFAQSLQDRLRPSGRWRICVWQGESGVGRLPAATLVSDQ